MTLVVDASVGLKWVLQEPDSHIAKALADQALAPGGEALLLPDFWLGEACNVCWVQVRRRTWTPDEARESLTLLRASMPVTPTGDLGLHDVALDLGVAVGQSPYDTLYVAFAIAMGARAVVVADDPFVRNMARHPDPVVAGMLIPLRAWGLTQGLA